MIAFSNTTPFIALASIDKLTLFPQIFGNIWVANAVIEECAAGGSIFVPNLHELDWVRPVADAGEKQLPILYEMGQGEKQTISLALKHRADLVIMDERIGRRVAEYLGLKITGALGVLAKAKALGLIPSFHQAAMDMRSQGIHYNPELIVRLARHLGEA